MNILLTNDDGINARGINVLYEYLQELGHTLFVVAPDKQQSATSHSITLHNPLRIIKQKKHFYAVNGTPTDCVILAEQVITKERIDLVISGINAGPNMGEDILYSGTVAAALEAMFIKIPSVAVSMAAYTDQKFNTGAKFIVEFLKKGMEKVIKQGEMFNINIPNLEYEDVKGINITKLGHRHYEDFVKKQQDPRGRNIYWIGGKAIWGQEEGTDSKSVSEGFVSITPMAPKFTQEDSFKKLQNWLEQK
ncbi:MAG TPA: 5'/3'-nucleotidase SurE [Candidatus Cloacimonas sp.]|jgi:5'-nucleotidase|nr:5'/3'-nucleotidase SurE [Candidatus Cloacimonas sp.]